MTNDERTPQQSNLCALLQACFVIRHSFVIGHLLIRHCGQSALMLTLLALVGCGGDARMAEVTGMVTVDDNPLENGAIRFVPIDGKTQTTGGIIKDGHYTVLVPLGEMSVAISAPKIVGKRKLYDTPNSREMDIIEEALPAKYNEETELRLEVKAGRMEKDFDLKSK